jgi:hypothetical protein
MELSAAVEMQNIPNMDEDFSGVGFVVLVQKLGSTSQTLFDQAIQTARLTK